MIELITAGIILGLSAGFAPGPLLALVISETLRHGVGSGMRVALAPLITDIPIITLTFLLSVLLADAKPVIGVIALLGSGFVLWLGISSLRIKQNIFEQPPEPPRSLAKGIVANALSPHPYIFWLTVGTPILSKAMKTSMALPFVFILGFYVCLIGAKILLAVLVGQSRAFLQGKIYVNTMRMLGVVMCVFALMLFKESLGLFGIL
jgi:threonine/homoserine/homoserine lactone efflux protein